MFQAGVGISSIGIARSTRSAQFSLIEAINGLTLENSYIVTLQLH